ncbi:MAG: hypothetical protein JW913_09700 [Chitinispirillaceae bacterium]|nr:hypothetical protein [Chitinispirillaceae bacterium]
MNRMRNVITGVAALGMMSGCMIVGVPVSEDDDMGYGDDGCYVDAYVGIPDEVEELIAEHVNGYSMPPIGRYGYELYPEERYDPHNLPSYVSSDFNGDGRYDYAYMFSLLSWAEGDWYLKTKLLIVTSTYYGYALSSEIDLGTVTGSAEIPVEEYWGIRLLRRGTHSVTWYDRGIIREERIDLENDGIYLASVDPDERSVLYVDGTEVYEIMMDMGAIAKKRAVSSDARSNRIIKLPELLSPGR